MKKSLFFLSALATLCLLIPGLTLAEPTHPNEVGLYMTPDGYGATGTFDIGVPVNVFLVLTKPTDQFTGVPFTDIRAFECQLNFSPVGGVFLVGETYPTGYLNIGDNMHIADGYLEYIVGYVDDWPVINEAFVLVELTFINSNASEIEVTLGPIGPASIPGEMGFVSFQTPPPHYVTPMYPVSGSHDDPVFIFNGMAVAVDNESFGSVKALYR